MIAAEAAAAEAADGQVVVGLPGDNDMCKQIAMHTADALAISPSGRNPLVEAAAGQPQRAGCLPAQAAWPSAGCLPAKAARPGAHLLQACWLASCLA